MRPIGSNQIPLRELSKLSDLWKRKIIFKRVLEKGYAHPKFDMENDGFQMESPFPRADFQVPC